MYDFGFVSYLGNKRTLEIIFKDSETAFVFMSFGLLLALIVFNLIKLAVKKFASLRLAILLCSANFLIMGTSRTYTQAMNHLLIWAAIIAFGVLAQKYGIIVIRRFVRFPQIFEEHKRIKSVVGFLCSTAIVYFLFLYILCYWIQGSRAIGNSMYPTMEDGDCVIYNRIVYTFSDPKRFDVVVCDRHFDGSAGAIKRIIALPGECIRIDFAGNIYINGEILEEDYGYEPISNPGNAAIEIQLGEDEYFVLGDNRNVSSDSRYAEFGLVKRDEILMKIWLHFQLGEFPQVVN